MPENKWKYGTAGDTYKVHRGDVWRVGRHVLACGDIEAGDHAKIINLLPPRMVYMDLPYDQSNLTLFRRKAGAAEGVDYPSFLDAVIRPLTAVQGDVYIETGKRTVDAVAETLERHGATVLNQWEIFYYGTKPCELLRASFVDAQPMKASPRGMDDSDTPAWAVERSSAPGDVVADFCVGQGLTAIAAARHDRRALGMDINGRRLAVTIDKLVKMGEGEAKRVGRA